MKSWVRLHPLGLGKGSFGSVFKAISSDGFPFSVKSPLVEKCVSLRIERLILEYFVGCPEIVHCYGGNLSIEIQRFRFRGTPLYMSPESVADGKIEAALCVWPLGCIVLEMIPGERPWKFNTKELLYVLGLLRASPRMPNCLSEEGKDFLSKCFEVNPKRRWTAEMLLKHPFVEGESTMCPFSDCLNCRVEDSIVGNFKRLVLC